MVDIGISGTDIDPISIQQFTLNVTTSRNASREIGELGRRICGVWIDGWQRVILSWRSAARDPGFERFGMTPIVADRVSSAQFAQFSDLWGEERRQADDDEGHDSAESDRGDRAENAGGDAGFEGADLVRGADENLIDRRHAAEELFGSQRLDERAPDDDADVIGHAAEGEQCERKPEARRIGESDRR